MTYSTPTIERTRLVSQMRDGISCAIIRCAEGHVCIDGKCVPLT